MKIILHAGSTIVAGVRSLERGRARSTGPGRRCVSKMQREQSHVCKVSRRKTDTCGLFTFVFCVYDIFALSIDTIDVG